MQSVSKVTNWLVIAVVVVTNTVGNILLGAGMERMPDFYAVSFAAYLSAIATNWHVLLGTALLIVWMIGQLSLFTWADLTYVLPVTSCAYILTVFLSKSFLGEYISAERWIGTVMVSFGVLLVSETPLNTKQRAGRVS